MLMTSMLTVIVAVCTHAAAAGSAADRVQPTPIVYAAPSKATYLLLADETEAMLRRDVLGVWFPRTVDRQHG